MAKKFTYNPKSPHSKIVREDELPTEEEIASEDEDAPMEEENHPKESPKDTDASDHSDDEDSDIHVEEGETLEDGTQVYHIGSPEEEEAPSHNSDFYDNLVPQLDESNLNLLCGKILEDVQNDRDSRQEWEGSAKLIYQYLGLQIEEYRKEPFLYACSAFDGTLLSTLLRSYSNIMAELFPAAGPAKAEILGTPTSEVEAQGERIKLFMNYYLTIKDREYYSDSARLLLYVIFYGCAFRKVYQDPIAREPRARFIRPQDFIVNNHTTALMNSNRLTEVMWLDRKDILLRQESGDFIEYELPDVNNDIDEPSEITQAIRQSEGVNTDNTENKSLFKFYECHVDLDPFIVEPNGIRSLIPRPYIVTIDVNKRKIVSVIRNWKEGDKRFKRREFYVHYYFLPSFGIYSLGLAQLCGSNAIVLTSVLRQLIDVGSLNAYPAGFKAKGLRISNNEKALAPGEFRELDTVGRPIDQSLMLNPYRPPSQELIGVWKDLKSDTGGVVSALEHAVPEGAQNMPVGTTLALLETANKVETGVLRALHNSLGYELRLLFKLFGEYLPDKPYPFSVPGSESAIMKQDFNSSVSVVPVSDPNVLTTTHRLMRAQALLQLAQSAPQLHNMKEVYHRMYEAMNVENIDGILESPPPPKPMDPVTENMTALTGGEITVAMFQDDDTHNIVHRAFLQDPVVQASIQQNPALYAALNKHIQAHEANKSFKQMHQYNTLQRAQQKMMLAMQQGVAPEMAQIQMQQYLSTVKPPHVSDEEQERIPQRHEIQNMVAQLAAQKLLETAQAQQNQANEQARVQQEAQQKQEALAMMPHQIMAQDLENSKQIAYLKAQEAEARNQIEMLKLQLKNKETEERNQVEMMKAQLKEGTEMAKMESQREIAAAKNMTDIAKENMKHIPTIDSGINQNLENIYE